MDLWEPLHSMVDGYHTLTSIEVTVTNRCNLRCPHCAVGYTLTPAEPALLPLPLLLRRLDEVEGLRTISITGGEPSMDSGVTEGYILPLLRYARERGLQTQINTNLTYPLERYEPLVPYINVLHISWNYPTPEDFTTVTGGGSLKLLERLVENARALAASGVFVSAESMINYTTAPHLGAMNRFLAELGCSRHEVHPMYPVDFAENLPVLPKDEFRAAVDRFLDERDPNLLVLFGTFPFLPCSPDEADRLLLAKARRAPNVVIRNCPDGRNRLNVSAITGEIFVTDFADIPPLGNMQDVPFVEAHRRWVTHPAWQPYNCHCPEAGCTGPNVIVAQMYHPGVDFRQRRALPEPALR
jgi:radical SAM/CxCxxxxC motif protein YfkAB